MTRPVFLAGGLRTPFSKIDAGLAGRNAIGLSVPVVQALVAQVTGRVDAATWGSVAPDLGYSNLAREIWLDAGLDPSVPTSTTIMACSTSMKATFEAAAGIADGHAELAIAGGAESMTHVQAGLSHGLSDWLRRMVQARDLSARLSLLGKLPLSDIRIHAQAIANRTTGKSMGEHCEEMAKTWQIAREVQDQLALESHQRAVAAQEAAFFDDLIVAVDGMRKDSFPRKSTTLDALAKLRPVFDTKSGQGTLTAGNSSPLTDGAAGIFVASEEGLTRLPSSLPRVRLLDRESAAVDISHEGLLMAPAYAIPRLLARRGLRYDDIGIWEIHEAFSAQVACHFAALDDAAWIAAKVGVTADLGRVPRDRLNPTGGSVALGHPFGATGARILAQTVKELAARPSGTKAIVSICADGGVGTVALLEAL